MLRRKADEWRALGEEHTDDGDVVRMFYVAIEVALRTTAEAVDVAVQEAA